MRVGVNLLWMRAGVVGGSEAYTTGHLRAMVAHAPDLELVLFALPELAGHHPDLAAATEIVTPPAAYATRARRVLAEATWLRQAAAERRVDVVLHPGGTIPLRSRPPTVLTVHDLQWQAYPQHFTAVKKAYLRAMVRRSVLQASVIVANSEFVKGTIVDAYPAVAPERIHVVSPAIAPGAAAAGVADVDPGVVRARYGLDGRLILYPAITYPHKNHAVLLEAMARLGRDDVTLVLSGGTAQSEGAVAARIARGDLAGRVRRLGRIPQPDLHALYRAADLVAFPSRYEGFGMGVVEAMAHGTPVVAARATALVEVVGDAGVLVDPDDPGAWAAALATLLDDEGERTRLATAARARIDRWSPAVVAGALRGAITAAVAPAVV